MNEQIEKDGKGVRGKEMMGTREKREVVIAWVEKRRRKNHE